VLDMNLTLELLNHQVKAPKNLCWS